MVNKNIKKDALEIRGLCVSIGKKEILRNISILVRAGEIHVIMGQNGSGKTTLANAIMGMPQYAVSGKILLSGKDLSRIEMHKRARAGLFLAFQNPPEIESIKNSNFMRQALLAHGSGDDAATFKKKFEDALMRSGLDASFYSRPVNSGFSGGERKKNELAQMLMLKPKFAVLDEVDSGLDVDAAKRAAHIILECAKAGTGIILITHSPTILKFIKPTRVYLMAGGKIAKEGGPELAALLEKQGFSIINASNAPHASKRRLNAKSQRSVPKAQSR
ncbi:MAG: Fe-S cluster assembly ATPase SufC [Candidatus Micrarchaeia archaeon]